MTTRVTIYAQPDDNVWIENRQLTRNNRSLISTINSQSLKVSAQDGTQTEGLPAALQARRESCCHNRLES